jgi:hypothetical protein
MNSLVKTVTWVLGIVLFAVGVLGFVNDPVLGLFEVDMVHNLVHLISGIVAIAAVASGESYARLFLIIFGIVYGAVAVIGFVQGDSVLGLITINEADNYLHTAIALVCLAVGFSGNKR